MKPSYSDSAIKLIVGLGNPGDRYRGTRHNIGFEILNILAQDFACSFSKEKKWHGWVARHTAISAQKSAHVWLLKPSTFMNLSGTAVHSLARFHQFSPEEILVIYDDLDLPLGRLRFREGGGHGGHNGVRSIIQSIGSNQFKRLKVGIGSPFSDQKKEVISHVLGSFQAEEKKEVEKMLATAAKAVHVALLDGFACAANHFNSKLKKQPNQDSKKNES